MLVNHRPEKGAGCGVCRDPGGRITPARPLVIPSGAKKFGKKRVSVDVAAPLSAGSGRLDRRPPARMPTLLRPAASRPQIHRIRLRSCEPGGAAFRTAISDSAPPHSAQSQFPRLGSQRILALASLIRSHGGLPSTTSNPPAANVSGIPAASEKAPRRLRRAAHCARPISGPLDLPPDSSAQHARRWNGHPVSIVGDPACFGRQERRDVKVRRHAPSPAAWIGLCPPQSPLLFRDLFDTVFGKGAQGASASASGGTGGKRPCPSFQASRSLGVQRARSARRRLVVAGQRLIGFVRNAATQSL